MQHNIMALVGNGFDIQVLSGLGAPADTRYESFYHYLKYRRFDGANRILERMEHLRGLGAQNWSDVENAIEKLRTDGSVSPAAIVADVRKVQREFANFLDQVATPDILTQLGEKAASQHLTLMSFTEFLGDIEDPDEYNKMQLTQRVDIGDIFNFKFINFNYTTLLDDFIYLDQEQFDPHPYRWSDRNITFHPNPRGHANAREQASFHMVANLVSDVVHPHGIQYTPRSLLFGIDEADGDARHLSKPYWAQNKVKYGDLFSTTDVFIIFGCSLGDTDRWWWRAIINGLQQNDDADLLLYWRRGCDEADLTPSDLRAKFASAGGYPGDAGILTLLTEKARVVLYDDATERAWLNTNATMPPSWVV
ncbi:AbiH family protein [Kocuria rosea]|uniref:AbiH family protein n=1 Tax=Kocuria rosea TaxID=1275 RepID=UPI00203DC81B